MRGTGRGSGAVTATLRTIAIACGLWLFAVAGTMAQTQSCPTGSATKNDVSSAQDALKNKTNSEGYIGPTEECAALVQSLSPGYWQDRDLGKGRFRDDGRSGLRNADCDIWLRRFRQFRRPGSGSKYTPPGTGGISGKSHTAIFLNRNPDGSIQVLEQWAGSGQDPHAAAWKL